MREFRRRQRLRAADVSRRAEPASGDFPRDPRSARNPAQGASGSIERLKPLLARGLKIMPQVTPRPIQQYYTLRDPFIFAALDSWKPIFNRSAEEQKAQFRSAAFRQAFKDEMVHDRKAVFRGRWDRVHVVRVEKPENQRLLNRSIAEIAALQHKDAGGRDPRPRTRRKPRAGDHALGDQRQQGHRRVRSCGCPIRSWDCPMPARMSHSIATRACRPICSGVGARARHH